MERVFGVSTGAIALALAAGWLFAAVALVWLGLRTPVLVRLGLRHVPRRRAQTILITLGLMLSTAIVTTALGAGDTMSHALKSVVASSLGRADETIVPPETYGWREGRRRVRSLTRGDVLAAAGEGSFPYARYDEVARSAKDVPAVGALMPAIVDIRTVLDRESRLTSPDVKLLAAPPDYDSAFGPITSPAGPVTLAELGPDEVYLNSEAAGALGAQPGHTVEITDGEYGRYRAPWKLRVRAVVRAPGLAGAQATALVPIEHVWERDPAWQYGDGEINQILVANRGDETTSVDRSREATRGLRTALANREVGDRLYTVMSGPEFREQLAKYMEQANEGPFAAEDRRLLESLSRELARGRATPEFISLMGDPEVISELGHLSIEGWSSEAVGEAARLLPDLHSLTVREIKRTSLQAADLAGSVLTSVFLVLGLFSIAVGVMLVFLIFVMLAAERRSEMGTTRALGARRGHLMQMFLFEGALYSLAASIAGVLTGLLTGRVAVLLLSGILRSFGVRITPHFAPRSLLIGFCLGGLLTFSTVAFAAWRVSKLNIVAAIRDLPDTDRERVRSSAIGPGSGRAVALSVLGAGGMAVGARLEQLSVWGLGASSLIAGVALLGRWALLRGGRDRARADRVAYTLMGLAFLWFWSRPAEEIGRAQGIPVGGHIEVFVLAGVLMVLGAVWTVVYNLDVLLRGIELGLRRFPRAAAVMRNAVAYPRHARFRTGVVLAMFSLVIFTMTLGSVMTRATGAAYTDIEAMTGGFELTATSSREIPDINGAMAGAEGVRPSEFAAVGSVARLGIDSLRLDAPLARWNSSSLTVVDKGWLRGVGHRLVARAPGYSSDAEVWRALAERPGLAVAVPDNDAEGSGFGTQTTFRPGEVWLRDPRGGEALHLNVVGLVDPRASLSEGYVARDEDVRGSIPVFGWDSHLFKLAPGVDARRAALGLELSFEEQGLSVDLSGEQALRRESIRILLNYLLTGFMGLGLGTGIAALGVIATRAVVERRRHIGILRAIGYPIRSVQAGLVIEASIVAALGIGVGVLLGLVIARNLVAYFAADYPEILYVVPWRQIGVLSLATWVAVLLTTILPAWQVARVRPADGLRAE